MASENVFDSVGPCGKITVIFLERVSFLLGVLLMRNVNLPISFTEFQSHQFENNANDWARIEGVSDFNLNEDKFELSAAQAKVKASQFAQTLDSIKRVFGLNRRKAA